MTDAREFEAVAGSGVQGISSDWVQVIRNWMKELSETSSLQVGSIRMVKQSSGLL